jgi:hypothetical protein
MTSSLRIRGHQRGAALLVFFLVLFTLGAFGLLRELNRSEGKASREHATDLALAQAKEALIGYAATYRNHTGQGEEVNGYLPCPDTDNDGEAEPSKSGTCGAKDEIIVGRLPWKTLGLPPLTDGSGECLWYVVSGNAKNTPKTDVLNWDMVGLFQVQDSAGQILAGATPHERPWAVILAPGTAIGSQARPSTAGSQCSGSNNSSDYLEGLKNLKDPTTPVLTVASAESNKDGSNNDRGLWFGSREVAERLKQRADFKLDIDTLLTDLQNCLNNLPPALLPAPAKENKGLGIFSAHPSVMNACSPPSLAMQNILKNWQDNLLYAMPATVNGDSSCVGGLLFSGERQSNQPRSNANERSNIASYLEGNNVINFSSGGDLVGKGYFSKTAAAVDLARCIKGLPAGAVQASFAKDFSNFIPSGTSGGASPDSDARMVTFSGTPGSFGGCLWYKNPIPLAGKSLRLYYEFQFSQADTSSLDSKTSDLGNGFTLQLVQNDQGFPTCGTDTRLGTLQPWDSWLYSLIVETDIRRNTSNSDPVGNHSAILINGNLTHAAGSINGTCNGSASGCIPGPPNIFEESPQPLNHNQRLEIATGCDSTCTTCTPAKHGTGGLTYALMNVWIDCTDCNDLATTLDRNAKPPNMARCVILDSTLNTSYVGITSGFSADPQTLVIRNFALRSE